MALFKRFFYRKPPDRLLEISERVYVFDCCFSTEVLEEDAYKSYMGGIVAELQDYYPDSSFMVFNFREGDKRTQISDILSQYDMTVMEYPRQYEGCPMLPLEMIHHFLRSSESWLSLAGQQNVLLMHCERGGWPVLAFMLAALLLFRKQYTGEQKTLEMLYKQASKELLHLLTPLNPQPSQLRYLQYISRRNLGSDWPPSDTPLALDSIILRFLPSFDEKGCRPVIRIYGQDLTLTAPNRNSKLLFSTSQYNHARYYQPEECEIVKIDIDLCVQGDVVLECIHLDHVREKMMFRVMFHTTFVRSSILMLSRDEVDGMWDAKGQMAENFRAEVLFSDCEALPSKITIEGESEDVNGEESYKYEEFFEEEENFKVAEMQHTLLPIKSRIASETGDADAGAFEDYTSDDENHKPDTKIYDLDHVNGGLKPTVAVANEDGNKTDGWEVKLEEVESKLDIKEGAGKMLSQNNLFDKGSMSRPKEWQHLEISFKEIEVATKNFQDCIGKGGYGLVYKGNLYKTGKSIPVAIKRLNEQFGQGLKEFLNEVNLLTGQKHPNLISLLGYCEEDKEKILVYEYAQRGSLDQYLRRNNTTNYTLTWNQRLKICVGAARGLEHLHYHVGEHLSIIHRDIKSANILLDQNWVAKVSDFGLSKLTFAGLNRSTIVSLACGTMSYIEPEYMVTGIVKKNQMCILSAWYYLKYYVVDCALSKAMMVSYYQALWLKSSMKGRDWTRLLILV